MHVQVRSVGEVVWGRDMRAGEGDVDGICLPGWDRAGRRDVSSKGDQRGCVDWAESERCAFELVVSAPEGLIS